MGIKKSLYKIYWKIQGVIVPTLKYSQYLYEDILKTHVHPDTKWLDVGCGHHILPSWREEEEKHLVKNCKIVIGIDYDKNSLERHKNITLKVRGDITKLPFRNSSFDLITANMVIEHLEKPCLQFLEIGRILKPGGVFIFHTPNMCGYTTILGKLVPDILKAKTIYLFQERKEEDIFNTYYRANSKKRINKLAQATGFNVVAIKMIVSSAQFAMIPPLTIVELIWIRILMTKLLKPLRTNIIAILRKE